MSKDGNESTNHEISSTANASQSDDAEAPRVSVFFGVKRTNWNVAVICMVYMISKTLVMAVFTFITIAVHSITGHDDPHEAIYPIGWLKLGSAITALPISKFFLMLGRFNGFVCGLCIHLCGLIVVLCGLLFNSPGALYTGTFLLGGGAAIMNFLRFAASEVCLQDAVDKGLALTYVQGAAVGAAVLGPLLSVLSHYIISGEPFGGIILILGILVLASIVGLKSVKFPPMDREKALVKTSVTGASAGGVEENGRSLVEIASSPPFLVALSLQAVSTSVMINYMAVLPLVMTHNYNFDYQMMSMVMMVHMLGMYATSFISGPFIYKVGLWHTIIVGMALYFLSWLGYRLGAGNVASFAISSYLVGVGWNLLSACSGILVLGVTHKGESLKKPILQSILDFLNYLSNSIFVFIVANVYIEGGWEEGVLYLHLAMILLMIICAIYVKIVGLDTSLDLGNLDKGGTGSGQKEQNPHSEDDNVLEDVPSSLIMARPSFYGQADQEAGTVSLSKERAGTVLREQQNPITRKLETNEERGL
jgi:MFS family permease